MIVYQTTKEGFLEDVSNGCIEDIIRESVKKRLNKNVGNNEYISWKNSLGSMYHVINNELIPNDSGIAIEYSIPRTKNRIDFIITGQDEKGNDKVIIIELKQWTDIQLTEKDAIVLTRFQQGQSEELHPSYQAWSYSSLLLGFNATVYSENIGLEPCAYLHNHVDNDVVKNLCYEDYLKKAPVFCKGEKDKLQNFITKFIKHGDKTNIMYRIDNGEIRPSKNLADSMVSMIKGNQEFVMIDDQKIVYETALSLARKSSRDNKNVLIVEGGPGTGKSVVAINLLVEITKLGLNTQYVTKNAAPRAVFESKLTGTLKKTEISNMFTGSGSYMDCEQNTFDCLIVDEAHRLNEKSGMFKNLGENQIKEIIEASKSSIFFIDEDQKVTWHDIGKKEEIEKWANIIGAKVQNLKLESQFRCNGSDGYLSWLDNILGIEDTANDTLDGIDYDFKIVDSPNDLRDLIFDKNKNNNKARLVAGYCWDWVSKKDKNLNDIIIPEYNFGMKWNLASDGNIWIISPKSVNEVGCIHTCQGLELDYVGVIVGDDFVVRDGKIITNPENRAKTDASLKGYKKELRQNSEFAINKADSIIKNTYRTLMTRGMKGCYVYFTDKETEKYFKSRLGDIEPVVKEEFVKKTKVLSPYSTGMIQIPLVGSAPCGEPLLGENNIEEMIMVDKNKIKPGAEYFIVKASGDSMNKAGINDGDLALCRYSEKGETGDRVVALLAGENVTIKYYDKKDGRRILLPKSTNPVHQPVIPEEGDIVQGIVQEII
ncbi:MAG: uncharacterized protein QG579_113 [Patescibacteria group bacterium]|jgi:DUF2075 family protein|nr:uncharacterized protein [Patescibacteria group bacterium]